MQPKKSLRELQLFDNDTREDHRSFPSHYENLPAKNLQWVSYGAIGLLYHVAFEISPLSGSPGKLIFNSFVGRSTGERLTFTYSVIRNFLKFLSVGLCGLGVVHACISKRGQMLHDLLTDAVVWRPEHVSRNGMQKLGASTVLLTIVGLVLLPLPSVTVSPNKDIVGGSGVHQRSTMAELASVTSSPTSVFSPSPDPEDLGFIQFGDRRVRVKDSFVRLSRNPFAQTQAHRSFDVALFSEEISEGVRANLEMVPRLWGEQSDERIPAALAVLTFTYDESVTTCNVTSLKEVRFRFSSDSVGQTNDSPTSFLLTKDKSTTHISSACTAMTPGNEIALVLSGEQVFIGESFSWDLKINQVLDQIRPLGESTLKTSGGVVALWHTQSKDLEIGVFGREVSVSEALKISEQQTISAVESNLPELHAIIPLEIHGQKLSRDLVKNGYQLTVYRRKGGAFKFPGDKNSYSISFKPGTLPSQLTGVLKDGRRVVGRLEGQWIQEYPEGLYRIGWSVAFNAQVIEVP